MSSFIGLGLYCVKSLSETGWVGYTIHIFRKKIAELTLKVVKVVGDGTVQEATHHLILY